MNKLIFSGGTAGRPPAVSVQMVSVMRTLGGNADGRFADEAVGTVELGGGAELQLVDSRRQSGAGREGCG